MTVRAAIWAFCGVLLIAVGWAMDRPAASADESFPVASAFRLIGDETDTRFVLDLSRKIDLHAFTLADPYRVVIDIPQVTFALPAKAGEEGRGVIAAFRFGLMMTGGSRMVFDLTKPARIEKAVVMDAADGAPARLVLELAPTDRQSFLRRIALNEKAMRPEPPPAQGPKPESGDSRPVVVLDPGHGGIDSGTESPSGEMEKNIVLAFAERLRDRLEKSGKYRVMMTRTDDTFIPLSERVQIAHNDNASLFVSIHADSLPHHEGDARGASVYTLSEKPSDPEAAKVAEKENHADVIAGVDLKNQPDDVAGILIDLAQRETKTFSVQFAHELVGEMKTATLLHQDPVKSAGFRVLWAPDVPSVLVELGYVSNKEDLKLLDSDSWRERTANAIAKAIDVYFATHVAGGRLGPN